MSHPVKFKHNAKEFKGLKNVESYRDGNMMKYTVGSFESLDEAKSRDEKSEKEFSRAFIIHTRDGKRIK